MKQNKFKSLPKLPPVEVFMDDAKITIVDRLTGTVRVINPRNREFQKEHASLYGLWSSAYKS